MNADEKPPGGLLVCGSLGLSRGSVWNHSNHSNGLSAEEGVLWGTAGVQATVAELEKWLLGPNGEMSKVLQGVSALELAESDVLMDYHEQSEDVERQWERWLADAENKMQELTEFKESLEDENEKLGKTVGELRAALAKVRRSPSK